MILADQVSSTRAGELWRQAVWFIRLRWLAAAGVLLGVISGRLLGLGFAAVPIVLMLGGIVAYNFIFSRLVRSDGQRTAGPLTAILVAQIAIDLVALAILIAVSGGSRSPFVVYLVFHSAIAGIVFPGVGNFLVATLASLLYAGVMLIDRVGILPPSFASGPEADLRAALVRLVAFSSAFYFVGYFAAHISRQLRARSDELGRVNEQLRMADGNRLRAVATVTHELRSPTAAAESLLETVAGGYLGRECKGCPSAPVIARARQRIQGLLKLIDDLLDLHQLELGEYHLESRPVSLAAVVADAVEELGGLAREAGVTVAQAALAGLPALLGDEPSVRLIVSNLLENAIRYNRPGGSVTVAAEPVGPQVRVSVSDTGVGIPAEELPRVFDVFYRGSYARQRQRLGPGLGLSLVRRLVLAQGGSVAVRSEPGRGSEFSFTMRAA